MTNRRARCKYWPMNEKMSHLSEAQINDLMDRYYAGEKATALLSEFQIQTTVSRLPSLFPPQVHEETCIYCNDVHLISKRLGKTALSYRSNSPKCPQCGHEDGKYCNCSNCRDCREIAKRMEDEEKELAIEAAFGGPARSFAEVSQLTFKDAVYLLTVVRHSASEDLEEVSPFGDSFPLMAPTFDFRNEIVKNLYAKGIVRISPLSSPSAFIFDDSFESVTSYYPAQVIWELLPGSNPASKKAYLQELEAVVKASEKWPSEWNLQMMEVALYLAKHECLEYFVFQLNERGYKLDALGEKTHMTFEDLLVDYSIAQIFNLTWQAVRDVTDYNVKNGIPNYRGKNNFIGAIKTKADKARAEGWEIRKSRRDFNCPATVMHSVLFNTFLQIGEAGFNELLVRP